MVEEDSADEDKQVEDQRRRKGKKGRFRTENFV
jgi:hypothetical protein